ncbi:MAG: lipid-A-disaccharide synthase [Bacteroidales bacterium]|nr:lipid-A-disaccharide synthase [Bacteroidales bacterium]
MKYYVIAGEASGDLHGANLIKSLKGIDSNAQFRVWGGDKMEAAGADLVKHYKDHAFMGIVPVIKNLGTIRQNLKEVVKDIEIFLPDALILIDYSGFNLRVAKKVRQLGITIFYYISPQVWAWRQSRVHDIKMLTDKVFTILPFEKEFYKKFDVDVEYVGHPLLDSIKEFDDGFTISEEEFRKKNKLSSKPIVALIPGSRKQELQAQLPVMLGVMRNFPDYQFVIAGMRSIKPEIYSGYIDNYDISIILDQTYELLSFSEAALVTSGTATLETALFNVPEVVCYRAGTLSYLLVKNLVKIQFISIVNLIMGRKVVNELIQNDLTIDKVSEELNLLLGDKNYKNELMNGYKELKSKLGGPGASLRAAQSMNKILNSE